MKKLFSQLPLKRSLWLFILLGGAGMFRLLSAPQPETQPGRALLVSSLPIETQSGYTESRRIQAVVRAGSRSELGFETGGRIEKIWVEEGDAVEAGVLLAQLDSSRLRAAREAVRAQQRQAEAELALAVETRDRNRELFEAQVTSQQSWDEFRRRVDVQTAVLERIVSELEVIEVQLNEARLMAPFAGRIARRWRDEGAVVQAGQAFLDLVAVDALEVHAALPASRSPTGPNVEALFQGAPFQVRLRTLLPERNLDSQRIRAIFDLVSPPQGQELRPGDLVQLIMEDRIETQGVWLPVSALTEGDRGVWTAFALQPLEAESASGATHSVEAVPLHWLAARGDRLYMSGPLSDGTLLVREGLQRIVPGQQVRVSHPQEVAHASR